MTLGSDLADRDGFQNMASEADDLTAREREVVELIASAKSRKKIAHLLGFAYETVDFHQQHHEESRHPECRRVDQSGDRLRLIDP